VLAGTSRNALCIGWEWLRMVRARDLVDAGKHGVDTSGRS
jgi:hypothetical protein